MEDEQGVGQVTDIEAQRSVKPLNLRRSCEPCRNSKSRCTPCGDDPRRCQRCVRDGKPCVFAEARQRPKKMRSSKARVAEMERRLDNIMNLLASNHTLEPILDTADPLPSAETSNTNMKPPVPENTLPYVKTPSVSTCSPSQSWSYMLAPSKLFASDYQDVFDKGIISFEMAEKLVADFRELCYHFPFVVIDPKASVQDLRHQRPFLLLGVLATTSHVNVPLQEAIERELRETLGRRVTMNGETNLDILQGLLVYIAWYYYHIRPDKLRVYQLCQMAVSIAIDMGITKPTRRAGGVSQAPEPTALSPLHLEEKRAFLGCYYLSSSLSITLRRPLSMKYSSYMDECCQILAAANTAPTDCLLSCFIHFQELAGDVINYFDYNGDLQLPTLSALRIDLLLKSFRKRYSELGAIYSNFIKSNCTLRIFYYSLNVLIHEIGLYASNPLSCETTELEICDSWYFSSVRTDALISALEACKTLLDFYLHLPIEVHFGMVIPQVTQMIYAVLILSQLARGIDTPHLEAEQLTALTNAKHYIDIISDCVNSLISSQSVNPSGYFWHFRHIFTQSCLWGHVKFGRDEFPTEVSDACLTIIALPSDTDLTETDTLEESPDASTTVPNPTYAPQMALSGPTEEEWMNMVADWPEHLDQPIPMFYHVGGR